MRTGGGGRLGPRADAPINSGIRALCMRYALCCTRGGGGVVLCGPGAPGHAPRAACCLYCSPALRTHARTHAHLCVRVHARTHARMHTGHPPAHTGTHASSPPPHARACYSLWRGLLLRPVGQRLRGARHAAAPRRGIWRGVHDMLEAHCTYCGFRQRGTVRPSSQYGRPLHACACVFACCCAAQGPCGNTCSTMV